jgi:hypothetical protein
VNKNPLMAVVLLFTADHQLVVLNGNLKIIHGKPSHRQRDTDIILARLLDVVGRVALG